MIAAIVGCWDVPFVADVAQQEWSGGEAQRQKFPPAAGRQFAAKTRGSPAGKKETRHANSQVRQGRRQPWEC